MPPAETYFIDCDGKGLSWRGWRNQYNADKKNYARKSKPEDVAAFMESIDKRAPHVRFLVIDTLNGIMVGHEFDHMKEKGYDKWTDLAYSVWGLITAVPDMRDDLTVIFTAHCQTDRDENTGETFTRMLTNGRKLDKVRLESKFTTVLLARRNDAGEYVYRVHTNGNDTVKTPMGAFEVDEIPNDITTVLDTLKDY